MKLFDIKNEKIEYVYGFFDMFFFFKINMESNRFEIVSVFSVFGRKSGINLIFVYDLFNLLSSPFIIKKRMLGIDKNFYVSISRNFFQRFEYFV